MRAKEKVRNCSIDIFRYVCAIMVVGIHTQPLSEFSYEAGYIFSNIVPRIAVPFFFTAAGYFYVKKLETVSQKLQWIISREGDADGQRLKPHYIAQLISEEIKAEIFEYQCKKHYEDKKRAAQKLDSPQSQPHYSTTNTGLSRAMSY